MQATDLSGRWCLITGASKGIGRAIAQALAKQGASLILTARNEAQLQEVSQSCKSLGSGEVELLTADMGQAADVDRVASHVVSRHGKALYMLVNNAGMAASGGQTPLEGDPDAWDAMLQVNLMAPMRLTRRLAPVLVERGEGVIINIVSVAGVEPMTSACAYAASKWGLRGWSKSCYQALRAKNIKVVAIHPGMVETDMTRGISNTDTSRMIRPEDIAAAVLLAVNTSASCCPEEITIRPTLPVFA